MLCEAGTQADLTQHINRSSFPVNTELFCGRCLVYVEGLSQAPGLFRDKQRHTHIILQVWPCSRYYALLLCFECMLQLLVWLQGRFKQAVAFEDALTGQEFPHEFQSMHGIGPLFKAARALIQRLSPSAETRQVLPAVHWHKLLAMLGPAVCWGLIVWLPQRQGCMAASCSLDFLCCAQDGTPAMMMPIVATSQAICSSTAEEPPPMDLNQPQEDLCSAGECFRAPDGMPGPNSGRLALLAAMWTGSPSLLCRTSGQTHDV